MQQTADKRPGSENPGPDDRLKRRVEQLSREKERITWELQLETNRSRDCSACGGVPLVLFVLGSNLAGGVPTSFGAMPGRTVVAVVWRLALLARAVCRAVEVVAEDVEAPLLVGD